MRGGRNVAIRGGEGLGWVGVFNPAPIIDSAGLVRPTQPTVVTWARVRP
jgi:hypothetical protein